jgi:hypothetical protein
MRPFVCETIQFNSIQFRFYWVSFNLPSVGAMTKDQRERRGNSVKIYWNENVGCKLRRVRCIRPRLYQAINSAVSVEVLPRRHHDSRHILTVLLPDG